MNAAELRVLTVEECVEHLATHEVARIALIDDGWPVVFPVNYRLVDREHQRWIALRARPEGAIDHPGSRVALQLDGIDPVRHEGWSVLVRGTMHTVDETAAGFRERFDPGPWLDERDAWLVIEPSVITGRRLIAPALDWAFTVEAYL